MNERIKELAKQAEILITKAGAFHNTPQGAYQLQEQHMKKFAELIVKECMEVASPNYMSTPEDSAYYVELAIDRIADHFGVEE